MAELHPSPTHALPGKVRSKKTSTRIDMTPMVDLAFLLLTFFVMTTELTKPFVMKVDMPEESPVNPPPINARRVLTLILKEQDKIYWYTGPEPDTKLTGFSQNGIRKLLFEKNTEIKDLYVMIKPSDQSRYKNLVDILDEMTIAGIRHYAVVDMTVEDENLIQKAIR